MIDSYGMSKKASLVALTSIGLSQLASALSVSSCLESG